MIASNNRKTAINRLFQFFAKVCLLRTLVQRENVWLAVDDLSSASASYTNRVSYCPRSFRTETQWSAEHNEADYNERLDGRRRIKYSVTTNEYWSGEHRGANLRPV